MNISHNYETHNLSWIHIGGHAKYFIQTYSNEDILDALNFCASKKIKYRFIGSGTNIYFGKYFDGAIIKMCLNDEDTSKIDIFKKYNNDYGDNSDEYYIVAPAYINFMSLIKYISNEGFDLSNLYGIPGSIGGAIINNAGAYGSEIGDYVSEVICFNQQSQFALTQKDMNYKYRFSILKDNFKDIAVTIFLCLKKDIKKVQDIQDNIQEVYKKRKRKFPTDNNLGSVFENYFLNDGKIASGAILDLIGSRKINNNQIKVCDSHANVITNPSKVNDVNALDEILDAMQKQVFNRYGIKLNQEIRKI
jgi:UDP-N-acetylmuramate dehydrogenase